MSLLPDGRRVDALKVTELKKELEIRGLGRSGAKKDLAARLSGHLISMKENVEGKECESTSCDSAQLTSPTTDTIGRHSEPESSPKNDNGDQVDINVIESDEEIGNTSTGTVIFVPKESSTTVAPVSEEPVVSLDLEVKTDMTGNPNGSLTVDSDISMLEPVEALDLSAATDTEPTARVAENQQKISSPPSTSGEVKPGGEGEPQSRRRNLWGARGDNTGAAAGQTDKFSSSLVSFSTDTLEKMIPTLTVVDKKTHPVDIVSRESVTAPASDVSPPVTTSATTASAEITSDRPEHQPTHDKQNEVTLDSSVDYGKVNSGFHSIDEEVVFMDATIEGGLDIDSAPTAEPEKPVTLGEVDLEHLNALDRDTRQVSRKRPIETTGEERKQSPPVKRKGLKETKAIGYLVDQPERVEPSQSPKSPPSEFVQITCLVRPFTVSQLREMISATYGQVVDLWLNRIKSASVVHFESIGAAISCREGLDGSRWPSINPRVLRCDFVNQEFFDWMKQYGDEKGPPKHLLSGSLDTTEPEKETRKTEDDRVGAATGGGHNRKSDDLRQKLDRRGGESAPSGRTKPGTCADISPPADSHAKSEPSKMLDDLFRKTATSPCIYWLPLTNEEAEQRAAERAELAARRGGTRATRSPFAAGGEPQRTDTVEKPLDLDKKKTGDNAVEANCGATSKTVRPVSGSTLPPSSSEKTSGGGKQPREKGVDDLKEHRRAGSPFMPSEKKAESASRPVHKPGVRDGFSGARRQRSSSSSSQSPKRLSRGPRPYREASPRRKPSVGDYSARRRLSRSRSRSGAGGRYRGRPDSSTEAYRRRRGSSPHTYRSRR